MIKSNFFTSIFSPTLLILISFLGDAYPKYLSNCKYDHQVMNAHVDTLHYLTTDSLYLEKSNYLNSKIGFGYGLQTKRQISNAVQKIDKKSFNAGYINDPLALIEGRVPGASIVKAGGNPNENYDARIRGLSNIHGKTSPTIIIDGIIDAQLDNLDPNDIQSIVVLKDAASTAIYGIRGANGVILVNTKKGKASKIKLSYNGYVNFESPIRRLQNLSHDEFVKFSNTQGYSNNQFGAETNWYDEILRNGVSQVHHISASGGNSQSNYYASVNYRGVNGVLKNVGFDRWNTRFHISHKALNERLTLDLDFAGTLNNADLGNTTAFKYAAIYNPTTPVTSDEAQYNEYDGYFQQIYFDYQNPVANVEQTMNNSEDKRLNTFLRGSYEITDRLSFTASYAIQSTSILNNRYYSKYNFVTGTNKNGYASKSDDEENSHFFESTLNWKDVIASKFHINAVLGYNYQEFENQGFYVRGGDFISDAFTYNRLSAARDFAKGTGEIDSYKYSNKIIGYFGRVSLDYKNWLFFTILGRYDGSSRFGQNKKYGFYPGISAGVDISEFINSEKIDLLKVRIGYGKTGNNLHLSYLPMDQYGMIYGKVFYNGEFINGYQIINVGNDDLYAPIKSEINVGLDFLCFNGKIGGNIDFYSNKVEGLLWEYHLPIPPNLVNNGWFNGGELKNAGLEMSFFGEVVRSQSFSYYASLAYTKYLKNDYGSFSNPDKNLEFRERYLYNGGPAASSPGYYLMKENEHVGDILGYTYQGISDDGRWIFKDLNHDGEINNDDRQVIGNGMPKWELGFGNILKYKNWELNFFFKGVFGHNVISNFRALYEAPTRITSTNVPKSVGNLKNGSGIYLQDWPIFSSYTLEKGNYLSLSNMYFGYQLNLPENSALEKLEPYFTANNLFVITSYSGSDPEIRYGKYYDYDGFSYNPLTPGLDSMEDWLMTRSFALGLHVTF